MRVLVFLLSMAVWGCSSPAVRYDKIVVLASMDHDYRAYTQGFEIHDGLFWESTGQYGHSSFRVWDPSTGKKSKFKIFSDVFSEGMTLWQDRIFILTWKAGKCFVLDSDSLKEVHVFEYSGEGWGLTHDGQSLIMSNGSDQLRFMDPDTFKEVRLVHVTLNRKPLGLLNELEYFNGEVWANIYQQKAIACIDPSSGVVTRLIDLNSLPLKEDVTGNEDVLNGIAIDKKSGKIFVTGKYWSKVYEVETVPKKKPGQEN